MSDIAPLVAATIRDKVVVDLMAENDSLRLRLGNAQKIEITSGGIEENEQVTYAEGNLKDGQFKSAGELFEVRLAANEEHSCSLAQLDDVRISVGGFHKAFFTSEDFVTTLDTDQGDSGTSKGVMVNANFMWVVLVINGWPKEHWSQILNDDSVGDEDFMSCISETLPGLFPEATVSFLEVSLLAKANQGAIQNLPPPLLAQLSEGLEEERAYVEFQNAIWRRMRENHGYEGSVRVVLPQMVEVEKGLVEKFNINQIHERSIQTLDRVITIHQASRDFGNPTLAFQHMLGYTMQAILARQDPSEPFSHEEFLVVLDRVIKAAREHELREGHQNDTTASAPTGGI